jgi:hypothetical protein
LGWPLPGEVDLDRSQDPEAHFTSDMMDTLGQLFYDSLLLPAWESLVQPDEDGPCLFLSTHALKYLNKKLDHMDTPSSLLRNSKIYSRSPNIMEYVCQTMEITDRQGGCTERFCHRPASFIFSLELWNSGRTTNEPETSIGNTDNRYWVTVTITPMNGVARLFVRQKDKIRFDSHVETNLEILNHQSATVCKIWGYAPRSYSINDVIFEDDPLEAANSSSGAANVTHIFGRFCQESVKDIPQVPIPQPWDVMVGLHELLSLVCESSGVKRKRSRSASDNEESAKRKRYGD